MKSHLVACLLALACPAFALAHHTVSDHTIEEGRVQSFYGLNTDLLGVDFGTIRGTVITLAPRAQWALSDQWALGARVPVHVFRSGDSNPDTLGFGDLDLLIKKSDLTGDWHITWGLGVEVPTGARSKGLGTGHLEISPVLSVMSAGELRFHGTLSLLWSFAGHDHGTIASIPDPVNLVAPHGNRELQYHLGVLTPISGQAYFNAVLGGASVLSGEDGTEGSTFWLSPQFGWMSSQTTRVVLAPQIPFGGHQRYQWKVTLNLDYLF